MYFIESVFYHFFLFFPHKVHGLAKQDEKGTWTGAFDMTERCWVVWEMTQWVFYVLVMCVGVTLFIKSPSCKTNQKISFFIRQHIFCVYLLTWLFTLNNTLHLSTSHFCVHLLTWSFLHHHTSSSLSLNIEYIHINLSDLNESCIL
jgi:hypothetical protein